MTLGDRCDEIVRLIDETLLSVGAPDHDLGTVVETARPRPAGAFGSPRPVAVRRRGRPDTVV